MLSKRVSDSHYLIALLTAILLAGCENKPPQPASSNSDSAVSENQPPNQSQTDPPVENKIQMP